MKSPFPGTDPYLEAQRRWRDFHSGAITYCRDALSDCLPEDYVAQMDEEVRGCVRQDGDDRPMRPDVAVLRHGQSLVEQATGGVSVATVSPLASRWPFPSRLVTAIEIFSPTNKESSGRGEYLQKRHRLRREGVNLVEIDLLIAGQRPAMARPAAAGGHYFTIIGGATRGKPLRFTRGHFSKPCRESRSRWRIRIRMYSLTWPGSLPWPTSAAGTGG